MSFRLIGFPLIQTGQGTNPRISGLCGRLSGLATEPGRIGDIKAGLLKIFNNRIRVNCL